MTAQREGPEVTVGRYGAFLSLEELITCGLSPWLLQSDVCSSVVLLCRPETRNLVS